MEDLSQPGAGLSHEELGRLIAKRRERPAGEDKKRRIPRREKGDVPPLSYAQQRLWFLDRLEPESALYNMPAAIRLTGRLRVAALAQSLSDIERRHEILRTVIQEANGDPAQMIMPARPLEIPETDLTGLSGKAIEKEVQRLAAADAQRPFDLASGPLWRIHLLRLSAREHVLVLVMHHIASDGWSVGVFFREMATIYRACCDGHPSPLPDLSIQYADYAVWQRQWMQGEVLEEQFAFWRKQLQGAPDAVALPADRTPSHQTGHSGARATIFLPDNQARSLQRLSRAEGMTFFMTSLTALAILLNRYGGQDDFCIGTPIANRNRAEIEGLIGFFVNTLVLRLDTSEAPSIRQLLHRVREVALGAYAHQDIPFDLLVRELQPDRVTHTPFFQVMFSVLNMHIESLELPELNLNSWEPENRVARFDLALNISQGLSGIIVSAEYNTDLFEATTIARLLAHFRLIFEQMAADPDKRIADVSITTEIDRQQILVEWSDTADVDPSAGCLHQILETQALQTAEAVAVVFEEGKLSYQELNEQANQLARHLQNLGVEKETRVAVCLERSLEMVVAILGVFKAGAAFVPLDPDYPAERLAYLLEDSQAAVLLTSERVLRLLPPHAARSVCLDSEWETIARQPVAPPINRVSLNDLAYIIYTSGTTGKPKGVMIEHGSLINCLNGTRGVLKFTAGDSIPCIASFSFDIFLFELFSALLVGGRVLLLTKEHVIDLPRLAKTLDEATFIHTLPSLMRQLLRYINSNGLVGKYAGIRGALVGGDLVPPDLLVEMQQTFPSAQVTEAYGPTEGAIICSLNPFVEGQSGRRHIIGRPLPGVVMRLYDTQQNAVPTGVPGEIYLGGCAVGRGYFGREELTRRQFLTIDERRYYKTGDLGRYLADGRIEFLGRADQQVKIRGFRIELEEIEAILNQHPAIQEAIVIAREDIPGNKRLVAYVVPSQKPPMVLRELIRYLKEKLPDFMVPSAFMVMDAFPLTPHRKVNRRALPAPDQERPDLDVSYVAPRDEIETSLASIWIELLALERVGVHDNFFQLGGHSLLATQVISRIREIFNIQLPLREFFESPTVAGLAEAVAQKQGFDQMQDQPRITAVSCDDQDLDRLLAEIDQLSEKEVDLLLVKEQL